MQPPHSIYLPHSQNIELDYLQMQTSSTIPHLYSMNQQMHILNQDILFNQLHDKPVKKISKTSINALHDKYIVMNHIARGTFGDVWEVRHKDKLNEQYAIKTLRTDKIGTMENGESYSKMFISEGKHIKKLNKIKTKEIGKEFIIKCTETLSNESTMNPMIVMELCGFSLSEYMKRNVSFIIPFESIRYITTQIMSAMTFIHGVGAVVHADLKPSNILIHYNDCNLLMPRIKIVDFGNAIPLNKKIKVTSFNIQSLHYRAPEVLCGNKNEISCLMDIWSIGCILYEFMNSKLFHHDKADSVEKMMYKINKTLEPFPIYLYNKFKSINYQNESNQLKSESVSYIRLKNNRKHQLMAKYKYNNDINQSISAEFDAFMDFIVCLLDINPLTRYSSEDALKHPFIIKDFAFKEQVMQTNHPFIKSSNDEERQSRIDKQFKEYEALVKTESNVDFTNNKAFTEIIIRQNLY